MSRRRKGHGCGITVLVLLFIFILAGSGLGVFFAKKYMPSNELADKSRVFGIKGGQVALILDNQVQEEKGIYEDGQVYLPVDWVNEHLNERFYWDEGEKLLVYALPESIVYADESTQGEKGPLFKVTQDGMYLSLGVVVNYTDIRTQAFATSQIKRVFIDTSWQPYDTAVLKKTGQVRVENRKLEAGEQIAPVSTFEAPVYTSISMDGKVRLGFHQVTRQEGNNTLEDYASNARGMNVIVPTWFNVVSSDGTYTSLASKDYVDKAHDMGLKVWAMVENVSTQESIKNLNTKTLMSSTSTRKKLIEKLMNEADTYGFDGFNLDFESLKAEAGPHYVQFIREMSVACRNKGLVLSVDNYVPSSYTAFYNRKEQGIVADYVIVMAYDEHYAGGEAGSVSSIPYVREGIENTLKEVPKEKVINAVPFYTRVWTVNEGKTSSKAYGISDARQWVEENQVELTWDKLLGQYYGETVSGSGQQYIWMEEEDSMKLKIDLIKEFDLAGVACWKLGFEPADIWDIVSGVK